MSRCLNQWISSLNTRPGLFIHTPVNKAWGDIISYEFKNRRPVDVTEEYNYCNYLFIRFDWVVIYFSMGPGQIHLNSWLHIFIFYVDNYILYMYMHITCYVDIMCLLICFYNMPCIHAHSLLFILFIIKVF